ncbi:MAG: AraC family transcriptional regulator [Mycobacterium sp.]|jgi:AraC-like DNA-binding protein|nr:AraC family transcriptional regulator [Mycobacterium sp.]
MANTAPQIHRPEHSHVEIADPFEVTNFFADVYGATMRASRIGSAPRGGGLALVYSRTDVGTFTIDDVELPGHIVASPDPFNEVICLWALGGMVACDCDGIANIATPAELTLLSQPDLPCHTEVRNLHETKVVMNPSMVAGVAAGLPPGQAPLPIRFSSFAPVHAAAAQRWKDTVTYVKDVVLADPIFATPLVLGPVSRLLAAVTLSTFPNTATAGPSPHDRKDHHPVLLRRAIEFIESNVAQDIALADIAEAVHVTPRAVQYTFRRHLDTTPLQYLRRLRLHYAHQDLLVAGGRQDTVTAIAARWGFMHIGRFAVLYHQTYRQSPHTTLHGGAADGRTPTRVQSDEFMALLLRTLWAYRGLRGDLTRTAAALAVYPSTVRYRLYRIRELTGLNPKDPRTLAALGDIAKPHRHH